MQKLNINKVFFRDKPLSSYQSKKIKIKDQKLEARTLFNVETEI